MVLTREILPAFHDGVHMLVYRQPPSDQSPAYRATQLRTDGIHHRDRRHRASSPQGSSSNECLLFRFHHKPINVRPSLPTLTDGAVDICDTASFGGI